MGGRSKALDWDKRKLAAQLCKDKVHPVMHICKIMGISKMTLNRYLREAEAGNQPS